MGSFAPGPFGLAVLAAAAALALLMAATFAVARVQGRHSVVDTTWGIGLAAVALVALACSAGHGEDVRRYLLTAVSVIWGVRLALFTAWRSRGKGEDPRYRDLLSRGHGGRTARAVRLIYLPQALVLLLATMPVQAGMFSGGRPGAITVAGAVVWAGGFAFETLGDWQLARFKADPASKGRIMDRGLWRYTRHPNYFGDACMWWGVFLIAAGSAGAAATVFAPLLMTYVLVWGTGARLAERRMAGRPGYAAYAARTSGFIPGAPRRR